MKSRSLVFFSLLIAALTFGSASAQQDKDKAAATEEDALARLRNAFDLKLGVYRESHEKQIEKLKEGYIGALDKLKLTLGKEGNLDRAAEVLAEIDLIKGGKELPKLGAKTDRRLRGLREKWDKGKKSADQKLGKDKTELAKLYLKKLDGAETKLTQSGKIREALEVKKEKERVKSLKLVEAPAIKPKTPMGLKGERAAGDLALFAKGANVKAATNPEAMLDGDTKYDVNTGMGYTYVGLKRSIDVDLGKKYVVERLRLYLLDVRDRTYKFTVEGSADGKKWVMLKDQSKRFAKPGWQSIRVDQQDMRYLRVIGLEASAGSAFAVVELEVFGPK